MYSRRRRATATRRRFARRGGAIKKLVRAVAKIRRDVSVKCQRLNLAFNTGPTNFAGDAIAYNLCNYSGQNLVFGTDADDVTNDSCRHVSTGLDVLIRANSEKDNLNLTVFLVSLRDSATPWFNPSNGQIVLTPNLHYRILNGLTMVNKKMFKIHRMKRISLGNNGQTLNLSSAAGVTAQKRFYWKFRPNQVVKNNSGNWRDLVCPPDPSQNYFLIIFNDNSQLDLENPDVQFMTVSTFRA